ncbi:acyltransferase family protein [Kineococcus sp. TBRC 1896]|uniref:Acyltransferase family protein n=1 Tax=Kineococcus mangrovi TaxID=1660183 RepID=A0ABV4HX32_9ACTN
MADDVVAARVAPAGAAAVPTRVGTRAAWPDAAKAACILLVVLGHVAYLLLDLGQVPWAAGAPPVWNDLDVFLRPLRMPLFFAISGLFAAAALDRPWRVTLRPRVGQNLYLHVLWLLVGFVVSAAVAVPTFMAPRALREVPAATATASTGLWYLYALAVYFLLARLTRTWPAGLPVALAAAAAVVSFCGVLPGAGDTHSVVENLVWFLAGARFPRAVRALASRERPLLVVGLGAVLVAVLVAARLAHPDVVLAALLELPTRAAAVVVGVCLAVLLTRRLPRLSAPLLRLGRRTLPVYVLHGVVLLLVQRPLAAVTGPLVGRLPHPALAVVVVLYPLLVTAGTVWSCLAAQTLAGRIGAGWLFALPGGGRSRVRAAP